MSWTEFDDLVEQERDKVKGELDAAREAVDRVTYIRSMLAGGEAQQADRSVQSVVVDVADLLAEVNRDERRSRANQLSLEQLLAAPNGIALNHRFENGSVLRGDNLSFTDIASAITLNNKSTAGPRDPFISGAERAAFERVEALWSEVEQTDVDAERSTIAELEPQLAQLESDDVEDQVAAVAGLNPAAFAGLEPPTGLLSPEAQKQITAFESYEAPAAAPTVDEPPREGPISAITAGVDPVTRPPGEYGKTPLPPSQPGGPPGQQDLAGLADIDPESAAGQRLQEAFPEMFPGDGDGETPVGPTGGVPQLTAAQIRDANQAEVEALLASQFGGFSFFLQKHRSELQVGLTADGQVVPADDPNAATVKNVLDVIVDQGITAPTRVLGLLENTEWWQTTDARMREYDVLTADMSEPQKTEYLEPVLDLLREEAQFLGFQLDGNRARELAEHITRMGEETDTEFIRGLLTAEESFNAAEVTASSFAAARDDIVAMSKRYFTPINEADAAAFAQDVYVGTMTTEGVEQYFREMAANKFPQLQNALNAGITPEQYFAPYKYEIERMLDRPNVDLYEEFGDIIQYIPDTGTGEARPMTLGEVRKYVRGLDEWQQSSQGTDSARALAFSIGRVFGEVA
jgi:hypothetical protein